MDTKQSYENVLEIKRISKKTTGGSRLSFSALVAVGDRAGKVGYGTAKALSVSDAIQKALNNARKKMITVPVINDTIPHEAYIKFGAARLFVKPAPQGAGVMAGGSVRSILDLAGIKNISAKIIGTRNRRTNVKAIFMLLKSLKSNKKK